MIIRELAVVRYIENNEFTDEDMVDIAHTYSKDIEHLEENIEATLKCHEEWMKKERYIKNYSLLEGAAGVMLSLLKTMGEEIESNKLLLLE